MIVDRYDPMNLFDMVPKLELEFEPELVRGVCGGWVRGYVWMIIRSAHALEKSAPNFGGSGSSDAPQE